MTFCVQKLIPLVVLSLVLLLSSCTEADYGTYPLVLNGTNTGVRVEWKETDEGLLLDIAMFMDAVGGRFTPLLMNKGIVAQYGKRIGFSLNDHDYGMVDVQLCEMRPWSVYLDGRSWVPRGFLEALLDGTVVMEKKSIAVAAPTPLQVGDIIPEAASLARALESVGYTVQQGSISLSSAIDVALAGYSPDANGNNAMTPYLTIQMPQPPDEEYAFVPHQFAFTLREDEGLVIIGRTPPKCDYFSFRSYFLNYATDNINPFSRQKIFTQFGDPINNYNIFEDIFYPPDTSSMLDGTYETFFAIVSTADHRLYQDILDVLVDAGLHPGQILLDIIDTGMTDLGNDPFADQMVFLHRFSNPADLERAKKYLDQPTLEILRLTPNVPREAEFLGPFPSRTRGSGVSEDFLLSAVERLRNRIIEEYNADYVITELITDVWIDKTGIVAIEAKEDVLGETRDALYLKTDSFIFNDDSIVVVYGVNHSLVPKSMYNNVSIYGARFLNGFGGITNHMYKHNVGEVFADLRETEDVDMLYIWKFAREKIDEATFAVPRDTEGRMRGIDEGSEAFIAFRLYIDPGSPGLIGPDPGEIIFDRVMVLTPR